LQFHRSIGPGPHQPSEHGNDQSDTLYDTVTGRYRLVEPDIEIAPGQVIGELGLLSPDNTRTLIFECIEAGELLTIG
jgi:hypothetical protein